MLHLIDLTIAAIRLLYFINSASGQSLYQILGLTKQCSREDIKQAYRKVDSTEYVEFQGLLIVVDRVRKLKAFYRL